MRQYRKEIAPMKKLMLSIIAVCPMFAQNIVGTWQGSLQPPQGKPLRNRVQNLAC